MPPNEAFRSQLLINRRNELQVLQLLATVKMMAYQQQTNEYNTKQKQVKTFTSLPNISGKPNNLERVRIQHSTT